jgi:rhamnosyltransferase subunit B
MARIILATFGSLGDLHPYIAIALRLKARGHRSVIATITEYRERIETQGIEFSPVRPDLPPLPPGVMQRVMDAKKGGEVVFKEFVLPYLPAGYEDLSAAMNGADLLVSHPITLAGPLIGRKSGKPWISTVLSPLSMFSASDPPVWPAMPARERFARMGPFLNRGFIRFADWVTRPWFKDYRRLEHELGLAAGPSPMFDGQHSPYRVLALFSSTLAAPQPDWPPQTHVTGFPFFDRDERGGVPAELERFLCDGPPPVVFTLGSSAVHDARDFFTESIAAVGKLGCRAVLITGRETGNELPKPLPPGIAAFDYLPFSAVFPGAAAIVHQGGIGTTGQAMRAGRPMLVMPYSHDQPDNAARLKRLGVARTITRDCYNAHNASADLDRLLNDRAYAARAAEIGERVRAEDGVRSACDEIEALLPTPVDKRRTIRRSEEFAHNYRMSS